MRNRTYGGVRGRKTKVGEKLLRFPPTRFCLLAKPYFMNCYSLYNFAVYSDIYEHYYQTGAVRKISLT